MYSVVPLLATLTENVPTQRGNCPVLQPMSPAGNADRVLSSAVFLRLGPLVLKAVRRSRIKGFKYLLGCLGGTVTRRACTHKVQNTAIREQIRF